MTEEEIESDLSLIGVSGLADKLQEDVRVSISDFIEAGIKTWIVTGDKDSTAKSIGYDTGILDTSRELLQLSHGNEMTYDKGELISHIVDQSGSKDLMISGSAIALLIDAIEEEKNKERR